MSARLTEPLFSHESPDAVIAYRGATAVSAAQFLADARHLAEWLPAGRHVFNVCADRYRFAAVFAACLMTNRVNLLPSTYTADVIERIAESAPDAFCVTDDGRCDIDLPRVRVAQDFHAAPVAWQVPAIDAAQLAAIVFTSGSTGTPLPYRKTWSRPARCVRASAPRFGLSNGGNSTLIGTVPPQHMYGFESTVLLALQSGSAFIAERPFYPADIRAAIAAAPRPRVLVSTPIHLRALLCGDIELPPVDLVVSATAPLTRDLAQEIERRYGTHLVEIYGSTETGQIATRRTAATAAWRLCPGVSVEVGADGAFAQGGHVEQRSALCDVIEKIGEDEFLLRGRTADLVNIAGKRSSFAYLNHQLNAIPGVLDGVFFLRDEDTPGTAVSRLAALAVAPGWDAAALVERLRDSIDPIFLPRPLLLVDELPRNATGKLPRGALQSLADKHLK